MKTRESVFDVEVRESPIDGNGVFAVRLFKKGEQIGIFTGSVPETYDPECDFSVEFWAWGGTEEEPEPHVYVIEPTAPFKYLNHANDANVDISTPILIALRDIQADEELTIDYGEDWHEDVDTGTEDPVPLSGDSQGSRSVEDEAAGDEKLERDSLDEWGDAFDRDRDA